VFISVRIWYILFFLWFAREFS